VITKKKVAKSKKVAAKKSPAVKKKPAPGPHVLIVVVPLANHCH
jgi:hypothetical protein